MGHIVDVELKDVIDVAVGPSRQGRLDWPQLAMWQILSALDGETGHLDMLVATSVPFDVSLGETADRVSEFIQRRAALTMVVGSEGGALAQTAKPQSISVLQGLAGYDRNTDLRTVLRPVELGKPMIAAVLLGEDGRPDRVALRVSHLATDYWGVRLLRNDLKAALEAGYKSQTIQEDDPAKQFGPLDVVDIEDSPVGSERARLGLAWIEKQVMEGPASMRGNASMRTGEPQRYWHGKLRSPRLLGALRRLGTDGVTVSGALLGAVARAVADRIGASSASLACHVGNRAEPWSRAYAGLLSQEIPICVPVQGRTFLEVLKEGTRRGLSAQRFGHYDPTHMSDILGRAQRDRGVAIDGLGHTVVVNVMAMRGLGSEAHVETGGAGREEEEVTFGWIDRWSSENLFLILDIQVRDSAAILGVRVDTAAISPDEAEALVRGIESGLYLQSQAM